MHLKPIDLFGPVPAEALQGFEHGKAGLLDPASNGASRVQVKTGRASVNLIQIDSGLKEGDTVILSDMSRWDNTDRVRLE